jgi:hypothetical protein
LAVRFTDTEGYFVSEASVYRLLKAHGTITGTWGVWAGRITVYSDSGKYRSRQIWGPDTLQMIAASIPRELTNDGNV